MHGRLLGRQLGVGGPAPGGHPLGGVRRELVVGPGLAVHPQAVVGERQEPLAEPVDHRLAVRPPRGGVEQGHVAVGAHRGQHRAVGTHLEVDHDSRGEPPVGRDPLQRRAVEEVEPPALRAHRQRAAVRAEDDPGQPPAAARQLFGDHLFPGGRVQQDHRLAAEDDQQRAVGGRARQRQAGDPASRHVGLVVPDLLARGEVVESPAPGAVDQESPTIRRHGESERLPGDVDGASSARPCRCPTRRRARGR